MRNNTSSKGLYVSAHLARRVALLGVMLLAASVTWASVTVETVPAIPAGSNAVVRARVTTEGADTARLYFRREAHGDFYFVAMQPSGFGTYWAILPRPAENTDQVELYVSVHDRNGATIDRSSVLVVPVLSGGSGTGLTSTQQALAEHLTVGDTSQAQLGRDVAWFQMDGISSRLSADGSSYEASGDDGQTDATNTIIVGDPGPVPTPKEVTLPRP